MRKKCVYVLLILFISIIMLSPVKAAGLSLSFHFSEATDHSCCVYYTTADQPVYSQEQIILGEYDEERSVVVFRFDGELADQLTGIRLDFANVEQVFYIDEIWAASAGVIRKQFSPIRFFSEDSILEKNSISSVDLLTARNTTCIGTQAQDPFLVFSEKIVSSLNQLFSHYLVTKIVIVLIGLLAFWSIQRSPFRTKTLRESRCAEGMPLTSCEREETGAILFIVLGLLLAYQTYRLVLAQAQMPISDFDGHLHVYLPLFYSSQWWRGWMAVPYCLWHLLTILLHSVLMFPLLISGALSGTFFVLFGYVVLWWMLRKVELRISGKSHSALAAVLAYGMSVLQGLYGQWIGMGDGYVGIYSMNAVHNPTQMCVKPFALLLFALVYDLLESQKDRDYQGLFFPVERGCRRYYVYLSILLFLSVLAKPTFAQMFIPTVGLYMLAGLLCRLRKDRQEAKQYFADCLKMLVCAVPSLLYILVCYLEFFLLGGSVVQSGPPYLTKVGEVWSCFSDNIPFSILLGMAFPLAVLLLDLSAVFRDTFGKLAVLSYLVGLLEALFIGEGGEKLLHGNFLWPMMSGMAILWTYGVIRLRWIEGSGAYFGWKKKVLQGLWILFGLHVLCGLLYLQGLLL